MKKVLFVILITAFCFAFYWSYERFNRDSIATVHPLKTIPSTANLILEINELTAFWHHFSETNIPWQALKNDANFSELDDFLNQFVDSLALFPNLESRLNSTPVCVGFFSQTEARADCLFSSNFSNQSLASAWNELLVLLHFKENNTSQYEGIEIKIWEQNDQKYYCAYTNEILHFSSSLPIIQSAILKSKKPNQFTDAFKKVYKTASKNQRVKILLQPNLLVKLANNNTSKLSSEWLLDQANIGNWTELDFQSSSNAFNLCGFTSVDSSSYFKSMANSEPIYNACLQGIPNYVSSFKWWGFQSYSTFLNEIHMSKNTLNDIHLMNSLLDKDIPSHVASWMDNQFASFLTQNQEVAIICRTNGSVDPVSKIHDYSVHDSADISYNGITIFQLNPDFKPSLLLKERYGSLNYSFSIEGFVYFTKSILSSKRIINAFQTNQVITEDAGFTDFFKDKFSEKSNFMYYCNLPFDDNGLFRFMHPSVIKAINENATAYKGFNRLGWQISGNENELVYHNLSVSCNSGNNHLLANNELWQVELDTILTRNPQLLKNHRTGTEEVLVQDAKNTIYLISSAGQVKWKKQIDDSIIGEIKQIDVYGNGKFQMLFNTKNKIYLLDINGQNVRGFPVNLPSFASNSLSVFDYQNNHDYRILIATKSGHVYNFDKAGNLVKGWEFQKSSSQIESPIQHFVIANKDFICFHDSSGQLYALDRRGKQRFPIKTKIPATALSNRQIVKGRSIGTTKCLYVDSTGSLVEQLFDGSSKKIKTDTSDSVIKYSTIDLENDGYTDYLISNESSLEVLGPDMSLVKYLQFNTKFTTSLKHLFFGQKDYFYLIENGELSVFNDVGELLSEFPKKSSYKPAISDMNKDGKIDLVFISGKKVVAQLLR